MLIQTELQTAAYRLWPWMKKLSNIADGAMKHLIAGCRHSYALSPTPVAGTLCELVS